jgi:predicted TIM-barrel fold metal-dependent hydrolase
VGFTHYDENNEELMQICRQYPDRFEAWPTVGPTDPEKLEKFKRLVERGAKGLKLYLGHGAVNKKTGQYIFHLIAIDDPQMYPLYQYCEENYIPVVLHVNPSPKAAPGFAEEFVAVLQKFPNMKIVCPHYLLSSEMDNRLRELLDCFPNLYTDVGFGYEDYLKQGMRRISKSPRKFTDIFTRYSGRIMFATDLVVDSSKVKTQQWIVDHLKVYLDMLTQQTYTTPIMPGETLKGLALPPAIIERVLYKNFEEFSARKPKGTKVQPISWTQMKITPLERRPGQTFPPIVK